MHFLWVICFIGLDSALKEVSCRQEMYQGKRIRKYLGGKWDILHEKFCIRGEICYIYILCWPVEFWVYGCIIRMFIDDNRKMLLTTKSFTFDTNYLTIVLLLFILSSFPLSPSEFQHVLIYGCRTCETIQKLCIYRVQDRTQSNKWHKRDRWIYEVERKNDYVSKSELWQTGKQRLPL